MMRDASLIPPVPSLCPAGRRRYVPSLISSCQIQTLTLSCRNILRFVFFFFIKPSNIFSLIRIFPAALFLVLGGRCHKGNATRILPRGIIGGRGLANRLTRTGSTGIVTILKDGGNSCGRSAQTRSLLRNGAKAEGFGGDPTQMGRFLARDGAQEDGKPRHAFEDARHRSQTRSKVKVS